MGGFLPVCQEFLRAAGRMVGPVGILPGPFTRYSTQKPEHQRPSLPQDFCFPGLFRLPFFLQATLHPACRSFIYEKIRNQIWIYENLRISLHYETVRRL